MLSFLDPGFMWALPLAGLPVLLHLIFLRRARRLPFSDLTLLRAAYAQSRPATRLQQWLLLLLRCLLLACLVLAFARPVFHQGTSGEGGSEQGLDVVVLLDTSWSMNAVTRGKSRFEWAVGAGGTLLNMLRPVDRVAVAGFAEGIEGELAWAESTMAARETIARMRVGERTTDIAPALRAVYSFLLQGGRTEERNSRPGGAEPRRAGHHGGYGDARPGGAEPRRAGHHGGYGDARRRIIVVLSDGAGHVFSGLPSEGIRRLEGYDEDVALLGLKWDEPLDNAQIASVRLTLAGEKDAGEGTSLTVRTELYGRERRDWNLDLFLRGRRADQRNLKMTEGSGGSVRFGIPDTPGGEQWGHFELRQDALRSDDVYYFSLRQRSRPKVLLFYGSPNYLEAGQGGYFLKKLLADGKNLPYQLDLADMGRIGRVRLEDYSAVILADFKKLGDKLPEELSRYVVRGGGVWIIAGTQAQPDTFSSLSRLLPGRLGEAEAFVSGPATLQPMPESIPAEVRPEDFKWQDFELNRVSIERRYVFEPGRDAEVWFKDSSGRPLLTAGRFGQGRVLLWASALDIRWSNLALKPVFAAWFDVGMRHLTRYSGRETWRTLNVGEPLIREWGPGQRVPSTVQIRGPGGRRASLVVRDRRIKYSDTRSAGIYFLQASGETGTVEAYAVNVDRTGPEGDIRASRSSPLLPLRLEALREDFMRSVYGREVRTGVLGLALLVLLLELFLSRPRTFLVDRAREAGGGRFARSKVLAVLILLLLSGALSSVRAQEGDRFVWSQFRYTGGWDPYPDVHKEILNFVTSVTSVIVEPERRMIGLKDAAIFSSPLVVLSGKQAPPELDAEEIGRLRDYLTSGGFLWIEDASGTASSPFDRWVRRSLAAVLPDSDVKPLPASHVLFKTFFLLRRIGGRVMVSGSVEGVDWAGKTVVIYSRNDLLGAWAKDPLGAFLYEAVPGGEGQRMEARKLTLNIILYALTGSYKADAVHQPFILEKMRQK